MIIDVTDSPTAEQIDYIADNLPDETLREFGGDEPQARAKARAKEYAASAAASYVVCFDSLPAVFMGVTIDHFVFVAATKAVRRRKRQFMLATREMLARTLNSGRHPYVWAVIPLWYEETVRWCRWLGARLHDEVADPVMGRCVVITFNLMDVVLGRGEKRWG